MKNIVRHFALFSLMLLFASAAYAQDDRLGNFEIQRLTSRLDRTQTFSAELKSLIAQPMPAEFANATDRAAWNKQTAAMESARTMANRYAKNLKGVLENAMVSSVKLTQTNSEYQAMIEEITFVFDPFKATTGPLFRRYESARSLFQALCNNEVIED